MGCGFEPKRPAGFSRIQVPVSSDLRTRFRNAAKRARGIVSGDFRKSKFAVGGKPVGSSFTPWRKEQNLWAPDGGQAETQDVDDSGGVRI